MADYLHYWSPPRASLAFDATNETLVGLESGWFRRLSPGDTLWVITRVKDRLLLVLRAEIATSPVRIRTHPIYAVGNSRHFNNYRVEFVAGNRPYAIQLPRRTLDGLRFFGASKSTAGDLGTVLSGPLGSMRRLKPESAKPLARLWAQRDGQEWISISIRKAGEPVFATAEHRSRVERAAVRHVARTLKAKGWHVRSREHEGVGYDLHCTKPGMEWHVEVKGTSGGDPLFFMTHGEFAKGKTDRYFRLAMVTCALTEPVLRLHTGPALFRSFAFLPLAYSVAPKK